MKKNVLPQKNFSQVVPLDTQFAFLTNPPVIFRQKLDKILLVRSENHLKKFTLPKTKIETLLCRGKLHFWQTSWNFFVKSLKKLRSKSRKRSKIYNFLCQKSRKISLKVWKLKWIDLSFPNKKFAPTFFSGSMAVWQS